MPDEYNDPCANMLRKFQERIQNVRQRVLLDMCACAYFLRAVVCQTGDDGDMQACKFDLSSLRECRNNNNQQSGAGCQLQLPLSSCVSDSVYWVLLSQSFHRDPIIVADTSDMGIDTPSCRISVNL